MLSESLEFAVVDSIAYLLHKRVVEVEIVSYREPSSELFACFEEVTDICAGEVSAGGAVAFLVYRLVVSHKALVFRVGDAVPCEYRCMTRVSARHYAVEHIHSAVNSFDDI